MKAMKDIKDIYENPNLYYILVPVVAALWPLLVWAVYLPRAEVNLQDEKRQFEKAQKTIDKILSIDSDRLEFAGAQDSAAEFDYVTVVEKVAGLCRIPSANYKLSSSPIIKSGGQKSQSANVVLKDVDITRFTRFLSAIQLRWPGLQCSQVKLTKKKGLHDMWDVNLQFKYYY